MQSFPKIVRGFVCKGTVTDIDMCNAHPYLALHLAQTLYSGCEREFALLKQDVTHREEVLNRISTETCKSREDAKLSVLLLVSMYTPEPVRSQSTMLKRLDSTWEILQRKVLASYPDRFKQHQIRTDAGPKLSQN
eukprot:4822861-Pleurochrysis_carterae.AAC.1